MRSAKFGLKIHLCWDGYHSLVEPIQIEKDRSLSALQKLQQYAEIFDSVWALKSRKQDQFIDPSRDEKLQARAKQLLAYRNVPGRDCD